ncbi:Cof-type HAD-IIB family hydrolase [Oceanobacillus timonensis]|uniref:Cof-type HAD-IIB family hydrolase n=1 Tax=Oceanobacillus timonensis TaxID=1926285 RepID=UPI0009BC0E24|nr:Cof-type HAD-IIB family hydrolase [Oceanobacillus timonensis]
MDIKLLALDMDGTTLNDEKCITSLTKNQILKAYDSGVIIVLCTGRPFQHCYPYIQDLHLNSHLITCNGGQIYSSDYTVITQHLLDADALASLFHFAQGLGTNTWVFSTEEAYYNELPLNYNEIQWLKFSCYYKNEKVLNHMLKKLSYVEGAEISNTTSKTIEINPPGVNKAMALKLVCDRLGITMENVMAVGDSLNDSKMIQTSGIGVAMENAQKEVKQVADAITDTNNNDGVGKAIEKFILSAKV